MGSLGYPYYPEIISGMPYFVKYFIVSSFYLFFAEKILFLALLCFSNLERQSPVLIPHMVLFTLPFFESHIFLFTINTEILSNISSPKKQTFNTFTVACLICQFLLLPKILNHSINIQLFA